MEDAYERVTLAVEEAHWWYRGRRRVLRVALDSLDLPRDARLLDAGCGSGRNMVELRDFGAVSGLEPSAQSAAAAEARAIGPVAAAPIEAMPFGDASFDAATSLDVIEHIDDDRAALRELRRVVRPGGFLVLTVPAYQWLWSDHDERNQHRRRYSRSTLVSAARNAGWSPVWTSYFNALLLPVAVAARLVERVRRPAPGRPSEFERTGGVLNPLLEQPFRLEAALLRAGVRLPAGLSLIGVFRREGGS
jgi:SAM-dependent methyltransferase